MANLGGMARVQHACGSRPPALICYQSMFIRQCCSSANVAQAAYLSVADASCVSLTGAGYLTAPKVRPRTICFWVIQPKIRIGAMASVEAAESLAQNSPSGLEKDAM